MSDPLNLSGKWDGVFRYPASAQMPVTPFLADIAEDAGAFTGTTMEPGLHGPASLAARIIGHRSGTSVDFTKTYPRSTVGYQNPVDYVGQISSDGQRVTGVWSLRDWNGEFEMTREASLAKPAELTVSVEV